jgi:hypothetical protein
MLEYLGQKEYVEDGLKGLKPTSANNSLCCCTLLMMPLFMLGSEPHYQSSTKHDIEINTNNFINEIHEVDL